MGKAEFEELIEDNEVKVSELSPEVQGKIKEYNELKELDEPDADKLSQLDDEIFNAIMDFIEGPDEDEEESGEGKPEEGTEDAPPATEQPGQSEETAPATTEEQTQSSEVPEKPTIDTSKFPTAVKNQQTQKKEAPPLFAKVVFGRR